MKEAGEFHGDVGCEVGAKVVGLFEHGGGGDVDGESSGDVKKGSDDGLEDVFD